MRCHDRIIEECTGCKACVVNSEKERKIMKYTNIGMIVLLVIIVSIGYI